MGARLIWLNDKYALCYEALSDRRPAMMHVQFRRFIGRSSALAAALLLALASDALAQQPRMGPGSGMGPGMGPGAPMERGMGPDTGMAPGSGMRMATVDLDHDGFVSADEAAGWHEQVFLVLDADEDDVLSRDEYLAQHMGRGPGQGPRAAERSKARAEALKEQEAGA